uniref:IS66 family insertion sequence element accessory protein TnpB n=1 Tax=Poseidonocella sp. HB161398 TaxID=2320855 RepID=UPI001109814F
MIPSDRVRILVATKPVDFRKGHDGLASLVQSVLKEDPFAGAVFVFRSKRADRLKILFWDGTPKFDVKIDKQLILLAAHCEFCHNGTVRRASG